MDALCHTGQICCVLSSVIHQSSSCLEDPRRQCSASSSSMLTCVHVGTRFIQASQQTEICAQAPPAPCPPPTPSIAHLQGKRCTAGAARAVPSPRRLGVNLCWWKWFSGQKNEKCCLGLNLDPHHPQELQCCVGGTELLGGSCRSAG